MQAPRLNRASIESLRTIAEALSTRHAEHVKTLNFRVHERPDTQQEQQLIFASLLNICLNVECLSLPSPFNLPSPDLVAVAATRTWPRLRTLSVTSCPDCPRTMNVASLLERAVGVTAVCLVLVGQGATEVEEARLSLAITGLQNLKSFVLDCSPTKVLFGVLPSLASLRTLMVTNCEPSASAVMSALGVVHGTLTELVLHDHDVLSYTLPAGATIFLPALVELSLNRAHLSLLAILDAPSLTVVELCNSSGERVMPPLFNDLLRAQPRPSLKTISFTEGFFDRGIYYKESGQAWQAQVEEWREMGFQILIFDDNGQSSTDAPA